MRQEREQLDSSAGKQARVTQLKVAIVCDWLVGEGGAERVVLEIHKLFPEAPIFTSQYDKEAIDWFKDADIRPTWLQKIPKGLRKFLPPLRAWAFSRLDFSEYDLVISSSGAEAKGIKTPPSPNTLHVNYCHAPTHYYWSRYNEYLKNPGFGVLDPIARIGLKLLLSPMRKWDKKAAKRPDLMIANSSHIQRQVKKYYGRDSVVIHPPVEIDYFKSSKVTERKGFVITGRQTAYKRFDLAVQACSQLGLPLKVIGDGPEHAKLRAMAGPSVEFLGHIKRNQVREHIQNAEAFIFPGLDDFGISPVEALAAGTPVIAYEAGGALDYIEPGKNGLFFDKPTTGSLVAALEKFSAESFDNNYVAKSAEKFSAEVFREKFELLLEQELPESS